MKRAWIYLINTFMVCTDGSYRLAVRISRKHDAALQAAAVGLDPFFVAMYNAYHLLHVALVAAYNAWVSQGGTQESQTLNLAQLLRLLSGTKAEKWMSAVKGFYALGTVRFKELFPDLKKTYQHGSQEDRIATVEAFIIAIGSDASLAALKAEVIVFRDLLKAALTDQKAGISSTNSKSTDLEKARKASAVGQYGDLGGLMKQFKDDPSNIGDYFDVVALRDGAQVIFHHKVKKGTVYGVCKHTSVPTDEWLLENDGDVPLVFALVLHKNDMPGIVYVTVAPHSNMTVHASALSADLANDHYLVAHNADLLVDGEFTAEIL